MVLRLLTHKVFIEVSLSGPTGPPVFGCLPPPPPFSLPASTPQPLSVSTRKSAITNRNRQQQEQQLQKAPQVGSPFGSTIFILHSLCAYSSAHCPWPPVPLADPPSSGRLAPTLSVSCCCWCCWLFAALSSSPLSLFSWVPFHWFACYLLHRQHLSWGEVPS